MTAFWRRRIVSLALLLLAGSLLYLAERIYEISLRDGTYLTGWILFVMTLLLALLNVRKRLSVLPLLPAAVWFQTHVYVGILAFGLFFLHSNFRLPNGPFEKALWWASVLAFATGILGLLLSRVLPGRLKRHRERIVFERIPAFRSDLRKEAECLALKAVGNSEDPHISDFYLKVLAPFLRKPRNLLAHLVGSRRHAWRLDAQFRAVRHSAKPDACDLLEKLQEIAEAKDVLDQQYALQLALKAWLFIHIPVSIAALLLAITHALLAYAFGTATP